MNILNTETIKIHDEFIQREARVHLALIQSGLVNPPLAGWILPALGETLIRIGTRLKEHSYRRLASEEASAPTFMIML